MFIVLSKRALKETHQISQIINQKIAVVKDTESMFRQLAGFVAKKKGYIPTIKGGYVIKTVMSQ